MVTEIIIAILGIISTTVSSVITYIFTKRKYNAEVDHSVIENLKDSLDFYKALSEDNCKKLEEYRKEGEQLRKQITDLQAQVLEMSINLCYDATCTARKLKKELDNTKKNGNRVKKNSEEK